MHRGILEIPKTVLLQSTKKYDMYAMTAAHRSLPLPTYAIVTNLENNKKSHCSNK